MFACIYCDDNTLAVLGKHSKRLKLKGEFEAKQNVELTWPGSKDKVYKGIIVKINENEEYLTEFAKKANKKFLLNNKKNECPPEIFDFSHDTPVGTKRARVATKKITESKKQDDELSPKKKKKSEAENGEKPNPKGKQKDKNVETDSEPKKKKESTAQINPTKLKNQKKKSEEQMSVLVETSMFSDLDDQFLAIPDKEQSIVEKNSIESAEHSIDNNIISSVEIKPTEASVEGKERSKVPDKHVKSPDSSLAANKKGRSKIHIPEKPGKSTETSLTSTWAVCTSGNTEMGTPMPIVSSLPVPSPLVLDFLENLNNPEVQNYCQQIVQYYRSKEDSQSEYISEFTDISYSSTCMLPNLNQDQPMKSAFSFGYHADHQPASSTPLRRSPRKHPQTTNTSFEIPPVYEATPIYNSSYRGNEELEWSYETPVHYEHDEQPTNYNRNNPVNCRNQADILKTKPRPTCSINEEEEKDDGEIVRLLASSNIRLKRTDLRRAWEAAKKAPPHKAGYRLASCMLSLIFSDQELGNSCGQGLKKKPNEIRPPLDPVRIGVLKDYVEAWCYKNGKELLGGQINDAITEQVSYSRKKLRKQSS